MNAFRDELTAFTAAVPVTPVEDRTTWQAMHAWWTGFGSLLHHHHHGEDTGLWPLVLER